MITFRKEFTGKSIMMAFLFLAANVTGAQENIRMSHLKLADSVFLISLSEIPQSSINVVVCTGSDSLLLVDAMAESTCDILKDEIEKISDNPVRLIINTHSHQDHTGGNICIGKEALIIGDSILGKRLRSGSLLFSEFPDYAMPELIVIDSLSITFSGIKIIIYSFPGCHDDSDLVVWLKNKNIVCLGDMFYGDKYPSVDWVNGNVLLYPECIQKAIDQFPDDAIFIPGHGNPSTKDELKEYLRMLNGSIETVKKGLNDGKNVEQLQQEKALSKWDSFDGGYISAEEWIAYIAWWLQPGKQKKSLMEELYNALLEKGVEGVINRYSKYKDEEENIYMFNEGSMYRIAGYIVNKRSYHDAVDFCRFYTSEYPVSTHALELLAETYLSGNDKIKARECLEKITEIDPDNQYAGRKLKELEK